MERTEIKNTENIEKSISLFTQKAGEGKAHTYRNFLYLVAQPLLFSTDLLYKLWVNFKGYKAKKSAEQVNYLVVSDLILSGLCRTIGSDLYRMEEHIRTYLLEQDPERPQREKDNPNSVIAQVAKFVEQYALRHKSQLSPNIYEIHSLYAKSILNFQALEKEIGEKLKNQDLQGYEKIGYLNLYFNALPLDENGSQQVGISVRFAKENETNEKEGDVIRVRSLPEGVKRNLQNDDVKEIIDNLKPQSILRLENILGVHFEETSDWVEIMSSRILLTDEQTHLYMLDDSNNVIGLNLKECNLRDLSLLNLDEFKYLESLNLEGNQITDYKSLTLLNKLEGLGLNNNQIESIDNNFINDFPKLNYLVLYNNPIKNIPKEIFDVEENVLGNIKSFLISLIESKPIREAKVVFVGEGGAGKTSLMHLLLYGTKVQTNRTEKIEIHTDTEGFTYGENQEKLTLHFWDFGGQEIMHATHKFFMSNRTLYVLVSNGRKNEGDALLNWVEMLKSFIGNSPVLLVTNHLDNPIDKHVLPDLELKKRFDNIELPVIETSWETGRGISDLKNAIQATLQTMPHFEVILPSLYQRAKEKLERIKKPYIDYMEYEKVCQEVAQEMQSEFSQKILADYLNDLGIMLNFRKTNDRLEDLFIFQPDWVINGVYKIINAGEAQSQKGKIKEKTVRDLLKSMQDSKGRKLYQTFQERNFIIDMMKYFNLAFEYSQMEETYYLIPSLFDTNRPYDIDKKWKKENLLKVRFEYEIWRNDYISYFLVTQHQYIKSNNYWINGAILDYGEQQVFIEANRNKKSIQIEIAGETDKRYVFGQVREALRQVNGMFDVEKLGISMWVVYEEDGKTDEFEYEYLKTAFEDGETKIYSAKIRKRLDIAKLLGEVSLKKKEITETIKKAILSLEKSNIPDFFEEMDKIDLSKKLRFEYARLKKQFISGEFNRGLFAQKLVVFAKETLYRL